MSNELTQQDKATIKRISELLAELKPLIYGVSHLIDQDCYNPYAPIAPVEEYVECVAWQGVLYTEGKIYKVVNGVIKDNKGDEDELKSILSHFKPSTLAAFTAQNTIAQTEEVEPIKKEMWFVNIVGEAIVVTQRFHFADTEDLNAAADKIKQILK